MILKRYETTGVVRLVTSVMVGEQQRELIFAGGQLYPQWRAGSFETDDIALQQAIEASSGFGTTYRLVDIIEPKKEDTSITLIAVDKVNNKQAAIEWLRINLGVTILPRKTVKDIAVIAAQGGYCFTNLEKGE